MNFPEELKIEAAEAYRQNILVPGFEHVNRNDWMDAWCCGVTYQIKKQQEEDGINNLCQDCVAGEAMPRAPRCRSCDNGSMFKAREEK